MPTRSRCTWSSPEAVFLSVLLISAICTAISVFGSLSGVAFAVVLFVGMLPGALLLDEMHGAWHRIRDERGRAAVITR